MRSRRFRKRIEVWQLENVSDGFGGIKAANEMKLTTTWADIRSLSANSRYQSGGTDFGINNTQLGVMITVRKRNDLTYNTMNQFIKYNNEKYTIISFPENKNFDNSTITFIAVKRDRKYIPTIESIDVNAIYDNYESRVLTNGGVISAEECQKDFIQTLI